MTDSNGQANATSVNAPYGVSEWALTGLTPAPCKDVKASRVKEAIFSVEGKLMDTKEFESRATPGKKTGVLAIIEGVRFWAREDAINEDRSIIDPAVSAVLSRCWRCSQLEITVGVQALCSVVASHVPSLNRPFTAVLLRLLLTEIP